MEQEMSIKEDIRNLLKGVELIMPSRNLVSQIIMLLPMEEYKVLDFYPQLAKDESIRENLKSALGITVTSSKGIKTCDVSYGGLGFIIKSFIEGFFNLLHNEEVKRSLEALYGKSIENFEREWLEVRIKPFIEKEALSRIALPYIKFLLNTGNATEKTIAQKTGLDINNVRIMTYYLESLKLIEKLDDHIILSMIARKYENFLYDIIKYKNRNSEINV